MVIRRGVAGLLVLALSVGASGQAAATTLLPVDFAQMISQSQLIVHARVVDVRGELFGARRSIESVVTIEVLTALKGGAAQEVSFRVPGGRVGRYRRVVVGAPIFTPGEEVVVFLKGRAPVLATPFGLSQGVYRVSRTTGVPIVMPVPPLEGVGGTVRGDPVRQPLALAQFAQVVREATERAR